MVSYGVVTPHLLLANVLISNHLNSTNNSLHRGQYLTTYSYSIIDEYINNQVKNKYICPTKKSYNFFNPTTVVSLKVHFSTVFMGKK